MQSIGIVPITRTVVEGLVKVQKGDIDPFTGHVNGRADKYNMTVPDGITEQNHALVIRIASTLVKGTVDEDLKVHAIICGVSHVLIPTGGLQGHKARLLLRHTLVKYVL